MSGETNLRLLQFIQKIMAASTKVHAMNMAGSRFRRSLEGYRDRLDVGGWGVRDSEDQEWFPGYKL